MLVHWRISKSQIGAGLFMVVSGFKESMVRSLASQGSARFGDGDVGSFAYQDEEWTVPKMEFMAGFAITFLQM